MKKKVEHKKFFKMHLIAWNISLCHSVLNEICPVRVSHRSLTVCRMRKSMSTPVSSISQSSRMSSVSGWDFWMAVLMSLQCSVVRCRMLFCVFVLRSKAVLQEKSSLLCRAEKTAAAAPCWSSEILQQWSNFSNRNLSTLGARGKSCLTSAKCVSFTNYVLLQSVLHKHWFIFQVTLSYLSWETLMNRGRSFSSSSSGMEVHSRLRETDVQCWRVKQSALQWWESSFVLFRFKKLCVELNRLDTQWAEWVS